jgi:hypothetical protein
MHMELLKGYLGRQPQMARVGGDLGYAMWCCLVHLPCHTVLPCAPA